MTPKIFGTSSIYQELQQWFFSLLECKNFLLVHAWKFSQSFCHCIKTYVGLFHHFSFCLFFMVEKKLMQQQNLPASPSSAPLIHQQQRFHMHSLVIFSFWHCENETALYPAADLHSKHYTFPQHRLKCVQASLMGKFKRKIGLVYLLHLID